MVQRATCFLILFIFHFCLCEGPSTVGGAAAAVTAFDNFSSRPTTIGTTQADKLLTASVTSESVSSEITESYSTANNANTVSTVSSTASAEAGNTVSLALSSTVSLNSGSTTSASASSTPNETPPTTVSATVSATVSTTVSEAQAESSFSQAATTTGEDSEAKGASSVWRLATSSPSSDDEDCDQLDGGGDIQLKFLTATVLSPVPQSVNVDSCRWRRQMADRLLRLLQLTTDTAAGDFKCKLKLVNSTRAGPTVGSVHLVYYAIIDNHPVLATQIASSLRRLDPALVAKTLDYEVASVASVVYTVESPVYNSPLPVARFHLVGAVACLAAIVALATAVAGLLACRRARGGRTTSADVLADEFYTDSLRPVPHMRANPKIYCSNADIEAIAEQVSKRLDAHMSEMIGRGSEKLAEDWHVEDTARCTFSEGSKRRQPPIVSDDDKGEVQLRTGRNLKYRSHSMDKSARRQHEEIERARNKQRLRSRLHSCNGTGIRLADCHEVAGADSGADSSTARLLVTPTASPTPPRVSRSHETLATSNPPPPPRRLESMCGVGVRAPAPLRTGRSRPGFDEFNDRRAIVEQVRPILQLESPDPVANDLWHLRHSPL